MFSSRHARPAPADVFTPTKLPLGENNAYVHRADTEADLVKFLERGQVPVVFGEYAVGKTTVVRRVLHHNGDDGKFVYVATVAGKGMSDVLRVVLEKLGYKITVQEMATEAHSSSAGAKLVLEGILAESRTKESVSRYVVDSPTDEKIARLLRDERMTIVIDELHRSSPEFRSELSDFIKATHGQESEYPRLVLIGTTPDASNLVRQDAGIDRFVKELRVRPMTEAESNELISTGFASLGIAIDLQRVELVTRTCAGAPSLVQSICLDMAENCVAAGRTEILEEDYQKAVKAYLAENGHRLAQAYTAAIEHTGPRKYRKQILVSMSRLDDDFPELEVIRKEIQERTGERVEQTALSGPLRRLKEEPDGILQDVATRSGGRVYNVSAFRDPMMKSFIRFMSALESQGLVGD